MSVAISYHNIIYVRIAIYVLGKTD